MRVNPAAAANERTSIMIRRLLLLLLLVASAMPASLSAQYFAYGKNRVQYARFDWRFIQSDHFDIYYTGSGNYYLAEFAAFSLESAYLQLRKDFNHQVADRIQVILYATHGEFSQTNVVPLPDDVQGIGGVTDKYKNRITVPFQGSYSDFRRVLHHELVHAVFNDLFYGGTIQSIISNNIQLVFPLWFEEGLAEFTALGWDTNTDMFIRDAIMNTYLPPIPFLQGYFAYRGGQSLWFYITETYGREKIAEILDRIRQTRSVEGGMRQALGVDLEQLSERWQDWLRKRYWPEITDRDNLRDISQHITKREIAGSYNTSPAITPQGDRIALITNKRGYFDVVVISAFDGRVLKTLIRGEDNVDFEELNILKPNLSWSPDGQRLVLSTRSEGRFDLTIVEYRTGRSRKIRFPEMGSIGSVSWSPDGSKLAFQGTNGPFVDIHVYDLETGTLVNLTDDIFSDSDPAWSMDSQTVYFTSDRGEQVDLATRRDEFLQITNPQLNQTDLYSVRLGETRARRLTDTPGWSEMRPIETKDGHVFFISDENGIQNIFVLEPDSDRPVPVTNLISGVMQMSLTADATKIAINSINGGYLDIFLLQNPLSKRRAEPLQPNLWAQMRAVTPESSMVPAFAHIPTVIRPPTQQAQPQRVERIADPAPETQETEVIDFRNYTFGDARDPESGQPVLDDVFAPVANRIEDGRFIPRRYRLSFSPDFTYAGGSLSTGYGVFALTQLVFSDLLGDHQLAFASNLVFDLRNSDYILRYGYFKNRTNLEVNYSHTARNYQTFSGDLVRYRFFGGGVSFSYPLNKFERIDYGSSFITITRDISSLDVVQPRSRDRRYFLYPSLTYTRDVTRPGFLSPIGGSRLAVSLTGSPPLGRDVLTFASLMGDLRTYVPLGSRGFYSIALRASGALSMGRDKQTFYLGGMDNWINYQWQNQIPIDRLEDLFFTLPAIPMRGHAYSATLGDKFMLYNAEFRFPLVAALLPGPIPIIPLYNITGAFFVDVGQAWQGPTPQETLVGAGIGLRTILLGLPLRFDFGWQYDRSGFGKRYDYISIGFDY
jgi:Tol biopolymer transport system component